MKKATLPSDASWVDRAHVGRVTLLQSARGSRGATLQELFWNRSITQVALLPGAGRFDVFRTESVSVDHNGSLSLNEKPLGGPLLVDSFGSTVRLWGGHELKSAPAATLWLPNPGEQPRLALYAQGVYHDGWLAEGGSFYLWPEQPGGTLSGWVSMRLTAQPLLGPMTVTFTVPRHRVVRAHLVPGTWVTVRVPVCATGPTHVDYRSNVRAVAGLRVVSATTTAPSFMAGRAACAPTRPARSQAPA